MVKPPNRPCLDCGNVHWRSQPCPPDTRPKAKFRADNPLADRPSATAPLPREIAPAPRADRLVVTKPSVTVTKASVTQPSGRVTALEAEVERLEAEVKQLKRLLAEANAKLAGRPPLGDKPMTAAERARKYRVEKAKRDVVRP